MASDRYLERLVMHVTAHTPPAGQTMPCWRCRGTVTIYALNVYGSANAMMVRIKCSEEGCVDYGEREWFLP